MVTAAAVLPTVPWADQKFPFGMFRAVAIGLNICDRDLFPFSSSGRVNLSWQQPEHAGRCPSHGECYLATVAAFAADWLRTSEPTTSDDVSFRLQQLAFGFGASSAFLIIMPPPAVVGSWRERQRQPTGLPPVQFNSVVVLLVVAPRVPVSASCAWCRLKPTPPTSLACGSSN